MNNPWAITTAIVVFLVLAIFFYRSMSNYTKKEFGKKWSKIWGNKIYFWQSLIFMSLAGTVLIMLLLRWANVLTF